MSVDIGNSCQLIINGSNAACALWTVFLNSWEKRYQLRTIGIVELVMKIIRPVVCELVQFSSPDEKRLEQYAGKQ